VLVLLFIINGGNVTAQYELGKCLDKVHVGDESRRKIIILDPGHGGKDSGTISPITGEEEKDITLDFAKLLKNKLEANGNYAVEMTREIDVFLSLDDRVRFARIHKGDIFISIHVDAEYGGGVRGATVYVSSDPKPDLAHQFDCRYNSNVEILTSKILEDLMVRETRLLSHYFAEFVSGGLSDVEDLVVRGDGYSMANFSVLKAPDMPSVLIELGFLSNRQDEEKLTSLLWRERVSEALIMAIGKFFSIDYEDFS